MARGDKNSGTTKRNLKNGPVVKKDDRSRNVKPESKFKAMPKPWKFINSKSKLVARLKEEAQHKNEAKVIEKRPHKNAIVFDTNVPIQDPESIDFLRDQGANVLYQPFVVHEELDGLKSKPNVGIEAREASDRIETIQRSEAEASHKTIQRIYEENWEGLSPLPRDKNDYRILANLNWLVRKEKTDTENFDKIKFITKDRNLRIIARDFFSPEQVVVEDYYQDQSQEEMSYELCEITVPIDIINVDKNHYWFSLKDLKPADQEKVSALAFNSGVVCWSNWNGEFVKGKQNYQLLDHMTWPEYRKSFAAIYRGETLTIINKDITASGIKQYSVNGNGPNWHQMIALELLKDDDVCAVFLQGGAGTGKTLLAVAAAIDQDEKYEKILITRPQVHSEDDDKMGFLPGNVAKKLDPWLVPIYQALDYIRKVLPPEYDSEAHHNVDQLVKKYNKRQPNAPSGSNPKPLSKVDRLNKEEKFIIQALGYIRGQSISETYLIVDEAQNLTAREIKTIITRVGKKAKIVFTGDLSQIDRKYLDRKSSGLAYAIEKLTNKENIFDKDISYGPTIVAYVNFKESVRSDLARYAEKVL